jgi:hypothetical protein
VIDLLEAAKETCKNNQQLSRAQVLLLDFAEAYDSLDRMFLLAVLKAKGFPPKILAIIAAMHENTTVKFMANGYISEQLPVTSGIRHGCPLALLLFIIAVDLLYDEVETDNRIQGINLGADDRVKQLKVAGYADDTAIYVADRRMPGVAIRAVQRLSAVSGLKLNVRKSAAVDLGGIANEEGDRRNTTTQEGATLSGGEDAAVKVAECTKYLGHIAGVSDTTEVAWNRAFEALRVRLVLAESKTNTVQQRAAIAAAIIVPKMLYVARHAWPTRTHDCRHSV